jgi:hypothetical protein
MDNGPHVLTIEPERQNQDERADGGRRQTQDIPPDRKPGHPDQDTDLAGTKARQTRWQLLS